MLICDFLNLLFDDALEDARVRHLGNPGDVLDFQGCETAVGECRDALHANGGIGRMQTLLLEARAASFEAQAAAWPDKAFWFAREVQVEWIAEIVSVILIQNRMDTIVEPTKAAAVEAARLAGVVPGRDPSLHRG